MVEYDEWIHGPGEDVAVQEQEEEEDMERMSVSVGSEEGEKEVGK